MDRGPETTERTGSRHDACGTGPLTFDNQVESTSLKLLLLIPLFRFYLKVKQNLSLLLPSFVLRMTNLDRHIIFLYHFTSGTGSLGFGENKGVIFTWCLISDVLVIIISSSHLVPVGFPKLKGLVINYWILVTTLKILSKDLLWQLGLLYPLFVLSVVFISTLVQKDQKVFSLYQL